MLDDILKSDLSAEALENKLKKVTPDIILDKVMGTMALREKLNPLPASWWKDQIQKTSATAIKKRAAHHPFIKEKTAPEASPSVQRLGAGGGAGATPAIGLMAEIKVSTAPQSPAAQAPRFAFLSQAIVAAAASADTLPTSQKSASDEVTGDGPT